MAQESGIDRRVRTLYLTGLLTIVVVMSGSLATQSEPEVVQFARIDTRDCQHDTTKILFYGDPYNNATGPIDVMMFNSDGDLILHVGDIRNDMRNEKNLFPDRLSVRRNQPFHQIIFQKLTSSDMGEYHIELTENGVKIIRNTIHIYGYSETELEPQVFAGNTLLESDSENVPLLDIKADSTLSVNTQRDLRAEITVSLLKQTVTCGDVLQCQIPINTDQLGPGVTDATLEFSVFYLDQCTPKINGSRPIQLRLTTETSGAGAGKKIGVVTSAPLLLTGVLIAVAALS